MTWTTLITARSWNIQQSSSLLSVSVEGEELRSTHSLNETISSSIDFSSSSQLLSG